ncbi:hypothetical protein EI94DRAFT_1748242 [Lactarius quietus]|nr:hypothetical protein EI94DRAFT_1748242 [Lactarius quietus]
MCADTLRSPPTVLTYCYNSKLVYVTPGESYEQAIDFVQEAFPELGDVDRSLIYFEVYVVLIKQGERKVAQIGRMAWSPVVAILAQYEIVEIRVASPIMAASSTSTPSSAQPPPYTDTSMAGLKMTEPPSRKTSSGSDPSHKSHITYHDITTFR